MAHLQAVADQASSSVAERLLVAEADDALGLVEVVRNRYDAVLMNPPFGAPVADTKPYLGKAYPWISSRTDPRRSGRLSAPPIGLIASLRLPARSRGVRTRTGPRSVPSVLEVEPLPTLPAPPGGACPGG